MRYKRLVFRRRRKRRLLWAIPILLALLVVYYWIGISAPFLPLAPTGEGSGDLSRYTSDTLGGERVTLIDENTDALAWRLRLIREAKSEILLSTYQFKTGGAADALGAAFLDAADRGVKIRILVDGISGVLNMENEIYFEALSAHPNIEFKVYNRMNVFLPWLISGRLHDKMFVIDDMAYIVGGRNTCDRFLGDFGAKDESFDRELLVLNTVENAKEASIGQLTAYFDSLWTAEHTTAFRDSGRAVTDRAVQNEYARIRESGATPMPLVIDDFEAWVTDHTLPTDKVTLITGETGIYGKRSVLWSEMKQLMLTARERVVMQTPYIVCSDYMYGDLAEIAANAPTKIITNSIINTDNLFTPLDYLHHQDEILGTGVSISEFDGEHSTHAKTVLIDSSMVLIGSFNLDLRSTYASTELMVVIDSDALGEIISDAFETIETESCTPVTDSTSVTVRALELPLPKRILWYVVGWIIQPFRFEL